MKNSLKNIGASKRVLSFLFIIMHGLLFAQNCYNAAVNQSSLQFPLTGGTGYVGVSFPQGCSNPVITTDNVPSWATVSVSGTTLTVTSTAASSYRTGAFRILANGSVVNSISITQGTAPPPPPCSISGFPSTIVMAALGETKSYPLSFSNCSPQYITAFKTTSHDPIPSWLTITQPSPTTINIVASKNDTGVFRSVIIYGSTPSGGSIGAMISQEDCRVNWYEDSDGDGFGDGYGNPVLSCSRPDKGNLQYDYVQNNDDNCSYFYSTVNFGCQAGYVHENFNWVTAKAYDSKGILIGSSKSYFDDLGKPNVSLSKDFVQNRVWGTETLYDSFGRPDKTSFVAPSPLTTLEKVNFFKTPAEISTSSLPSLLPVSSPVTSSATFQAMDLITATSPISTGLTVNFNAKAIVLKEGFSVTATAGSSFKATPVDFPDNSVKASLANYYSDSNTLEPYQATAEQPFSQNNYDTLNPGNVINVVGGNKINGEWKTGYSYTVPAAQEMYYVYGSNYYDGSIVSGKEEVITKFYKSVSLDANGVENVTFTDGEGKLLATARSGGATSYPVVSLIGTQGFVDVHIPAGTNSATLLGLYYKDPSSGRYVSKNASDEYKIYDLKTGTIVTTALTGGNAYRIVALNAPTVDPKVYISGGIPVSENDALGISYSVNYYDYAVNVYNKTGQLIKSIQPNGYVANSTIVAAPAHMTSSNFATAYVYNALGQVVQTTSPDEGTSKFTYRKDGQIRYSQSELQKDTKVSYTNYDTYGRPVESGVITIATGIWTTANANADTVAPIGTLAQRSEQTFTVYDDSTNNQTSVALPTAPSNLTLAGVLTTAGISTTNYIQNNLSGNVAITYTKPGTAITAITWYSYDIYGRAEWIVQYNEGIGAKTIHYEYDYKGNVKKVLYQKDKTAELFAHQYTYDANDVLKKVETSTDNITFITHADYSYYLTGELKRVKIAEGLQGLDYVYTLGGQLKSINHPSLEAAKDPGGDANDVFGITLDYYNGDYLRTGRNITSSPSAGADYNGNIKAARWANKGVAGDYSGSTASQKGYLYTYNRNNWLTGAVFGNTDAATAAISAVTKYKEGGLTYDANGNIIALQRTNQDGTLQDNLTYNYNANKNQLNSVADAIGASTSVNDIGDQTLGNYQYDFIGQMIRNNLEDINYYYNTQGLVKQVNKGVNAVVKFFYNERGQRIKKESYNTAAPYTLQSTDYYVLDLSGNVMSIYSKSSVSGSTIDQKDLPIFGLSRLGVYNRSSVASTYEITDHLGNVRAVIQRKTDGTLDIPSFADYYPFGEQLIGRSVTNNYRYAFQGQELDTETNMEAFQLRLWDGRIGRWLNPDPYGQNYSPYMGMGNNPISMIDPDGGNCFDSNNNPVPCGDMNSAYKNSSTDIVQLNDVIIGGKSSYSWGDFKSDTYNFLNRGDIAADSFGKSFGQFIAGFHPAVALMNAYKGYTGGQDIYGNEMGKGGAAFEGATAVLPFMKIGKLGVASEKFGMNVVYHSVEGGATKYVGITNNFARREAEHLAKSGMKIEPLLAGLTRSEAKGVEQALIQIHGLGKNGGTLKNLINSMAKLNPNYASRLEKGYELLKTIGYQ